MNKLSIQDLPVIEELDRHAMSAVRGGMSSFFGLPVFNASSMKIDTSIAQYNAQSQNTIANTGDNIAYGENIRARVNPHQEASNVATVSIFGGPAAA
jgi:hypothetical protein